MLAEGDRARWSGDEAAAERAYRDALQEDPAEHRAHIGLQILRLRRGEDLPLRREYREASLPYLAGRLEGDPARRREGFLRSPEPWRTLGLAALAAEAGDLERAESFYRSILQADAGAFTASLSLARTLHARGQMGEARRVFLDAHWLYPSHPGPALGLSSLADLRGDLREAHAWALEACRLAPAEESCLWRLTETASRLGGKERLRASAQVLLEGRGTLGLAPLLAAQLLREAGAQPQAKEALDRARLEGASAEECARVASGNHASGAMGGFLDAFVQGVEARYRHYAATGQAESMEEFQAWAYRLFRKKTSRDLGKPARARDFPFLGRLVDPRADGEDALVAECARAGMVLIMGQRRGGPPEAIVGELERRESGRVLVRGMEVEREVIWMKQRRLSGYEEWGGGGDLAGLALDRLVLIDMDAVRRWEGQIRRRNMRLAASGSAILEEPALEDEPVGACNDPAGVGDRLLFRSPLSVEEEVLVHENAHLVDAATRLPVEEHAFRNLALAVSRGFSAREIAAFLERNAQLSAIAEGPTPLASLGVCCSMLSEEGPHASGYREIVRGFVAEIAARPRNYPEIDTRRVILQQLHRLPAEKVRAIAQTLSERWGVWQGGGSRPPQ